jgi:hypothetical protein
VRRVKGAALLLVLSALVAGCAAAGSPGLLGGFSTPFAEADARVRGDLGIPDEAPSPRIVLADAKTLAGLDAEVRSTLHVTGGGLYDPNTKTIYLDASRYREASLYHELAHHYMRFMTERQREECLARLYELHVTRSSFPGCVR